MQIAIIFILILAILLVIFTLQNSVEITIHAFFWEINNVPLVLLLLVCIVIGYLVAVIYFYPRIWKLKKEHRHLKRYNEELKKSNDPGYNKNEEFSSNPEGIKLDDAEEDKNTFFDD